MMKQLVSLVLILWIAVTPVYPVGVDSTDTTPVHVRHFDAGKMAAYKTDRDLNYDETIERKQGGLLDIIYYYWDRFQYKLLHTHMGKVSVYDLLLYALLIFAAVMIVWQLFKVQAHGMFDRESSPFVPFRTEAGNIMETDFDALINEATAKSNYRLAIRLLYLKSLRKLSEAGLINWQKNKTNFEYYYELRDENLRKQFYDLTLSFEYAWYGNVDIPVDFFDQKARSFHSFLQSIHN